MTMQSTTSISCPACGRGQPFTIWQTLNATLDPQLKDRLLARELTTFLCGSCGHRADVLYPLLYHDMNRQFMVWLVPGAGRPEPLDPSLFGSLGKQVGQGYTYRFVRTRNELIEKVRIFEDGLDDRILELLKAFVRHSQNADRTLADGSLFYDGSLAAPSQEKQIRLVLVGGVEPTALALNVGAYDDLQTRFAQALPGQAPGEWLEVNQDYVLGLLEALTRDHRGQAESSSE